MAPHAYDSIIGVDLVAQGQEFTWRDWPSVSLGSPIR
jgi:hypothetical protein